MKIVKEEVSQEIKKGDIVESLDSGNFYLVVKRGMDGYSIVDLKEFTLHVTNSPSPKQAIERVVSGKYVVYKENELTLKTAK